MKRRWIAAILALCMVLPMATSVFASTGYEGHVNTEALVEGGKKMYMTNEGNYSSVVCADGDGSTQAVSMGILGWHASKALELMKMICAKAPEYSRQVLGDSLYYEIVNAAATAWNYRTFSSSEAARASTLLGSSYGIAAQEELARKDILRQVGEAWDQGVRSEAAILYYCSMSNQYGPYGAAGKMPYIRAALGITENQTINSLETFHAGVVEAAKTNSSIGNYLNYRVKIYNFIKYTLGWDTNGGSVPGSSTATDPTPAPEPTSKYFSDVPASSWACEGIEYVYEKGLFAGTGNGSTFSPDENMTRAMVVAVLYRLDGRPGTSFVNMPFTDVPSDAYYYDAVVWASSRNIVSGTSATTFAPDKSVTREELSALLYRYATYKGTAGYVNPSALQTGGYSDSGKVSDFATIAMCWAVSRGLIKGSKNDGVTLLDPLGTATRAQVASIFMRYLKG